MRIIGDGSCQIGENDRTIVHISGEKSTPRETEPEEETPETTLFTAQADAVTLTSNGNTVWDGVLGSKYYSPKTLKMMWVSSITRDLEPDEDGYIYPVNKENLVPVQFNEEVEVEQVWYPLRLYLSLGSVVNSKVANVSLELQTKMGLRGADDEWRKWYGAWDWGFCSEERLKEDFTSDWCSKTYQIGWPYYYGDRYNAYNFEIKPQHTFPGTLKVKVTGCTYEFRMSTVRVMDAPKVDTAPYFNLNTTGNSEYKVDYQPPALRLETDEGQKIDAFYPTDEMIHITCDEDNLQKHGMYLKGVFVATRELTEDEMNPWRNYAAYLSRDELSISAFDLIKKIGCATDCYYFYPDYGTSDVKVHFEKSEDGSFIQASTESVSTRTGAIIQGRGYAGAGKAITGYAVYGENTSYGNKKPRTLIGIYRHTANNSLLGSDEPANRFFVPSASYALTDVYIVPLTEYQGFTIKPHTSTQNETIYETVTDPSTGQQVEREVTYAGRVYLDRTFGETVDSTAQIMGDQDGKIEFDAVNSGSVFTLKTLAPEGYITEWVNGTMDFDEDGVIDNDQSGSMSQSQVDSLYIPVYGNQFVYQVQQVNPKYYYRFTKIDPSRLLNGQTRVGYVMQDKRTILDYDGTEAQYKDLVPCSGAVVQIGDNTAVTDENGRYEINMDGVPDAARVSAAVRTSDGVFITHVQSNVENNISIPFYDTFMPFGVTAKYNNEKAVSVRGLAIEDNVLTVTVKVKHEENGMYIQNALFYITDSSGNKVLDCNEKMKDPDSSYQITYTNDGTYGYATLKMNPKTDMVSGNQIYVQFVDQNGATHRAMNLGYRFIQQLDLGTFVLGAIGSSSVADVTTKAVDLLGAPLFDFDMGQISGFNTTSGILEPDAQLYDNGNPVYLYDATLYSYSWASEGFGNWSKTSGGAGTSDKEEGSTGSGGSSSGGASSESGSTGGASSDPGANTDASQFNAQHGELLSKMQSGEPSKFEMEDETSGSGAQDTEQQKPTGAGLSNSKKATVASQYNFDLSPSMQFKLITTVRPVTAGDGSVTYKHYFEEMLLGVGLNFSAASKTEISFPIGISIMIKPSLSGSVEAAYYMKTNYGDDKYWTERAIEYSADSFGLFQDYGDNMIRGGYVSINPKIAIAAGVKVAIAEVDVNAFFDIAMEFQFSNLETKTYGNMEYNVGISILILNFSVYDLDLFNDTVHLFGQSEPINGGDVSLMSTQMNRVVQSAFSSGNTEVSAADRSYLSERGAWNESGLNAEAASVRFSSANALMDASNTLDRLLQNGVMPGGQMDSAMLDDDTMFVVYIDDDTDRGPNDRSCAYYTYTNEDGSWKAPVPLEDDGTADSEPVVYDMGDRLMVAWLTADRTFDSAEDSLETVRQSLNALNIHAAFFDKGTKKMSQIYEVTKTTDADNSAEGSLAVTSLGNGNVRIYYTKTQYSQNPVNVNDLIATDSVIAYRDYDGSTDSWSTEMTQMEKDNITEKGESVEQYAEQWYGQHFVDTRMNGAWPMITDLEADICGDDWTYFAFVADRDGSRETTGDRRIFLLFDIYAAPVCITPEEGAYDDLQFCYSGAELLLMFKTDKAKGMVDGKEKNLGGISYINLSDVFEKQNYQASFDSANGYFQMVRKATEDGETIEIPFTPEDAILLEGMIQNYTVFADSGQRVYLMWNENTIKKDETSSIQIYTSVYNGNPEWTQGADNDIRVIGSTWSYPVLLTSPDDGSYNSFTAQSIIGDGIVFVAKRTSADEDQTPQLVFHLRAPYAAFAFEEQLFNTKYIYAGEPNYLTANIMNVGLMAENTERVITETWNTWKALPGKYRITFESVTDDDVVEIESHVVETVWNVGTILSAGCTWTPEEVEDHMNLRISVTNEETGKEICSETRPVVRKTELNLGQLELLSQGKNNVCVRFTLSNSGNIAATPTVVIRAVEADGAATELTRIQTQELIPLATTQQNIPVEIPVEYQTIADGEGAFRLLIEIMEADKVSYSTEATGSIAYNAEAIRDIEAIKAFNVKETALLLNKGETAQLTAELKETTGSERNRVVYTSSDESVAYVNADGKVTAVGNGNAVITAYAVPKTEWVSVLPDGSSEVRDMREMIPESMLKSQEINVTVGEEETPWKNPFTDVHEGEWFYSDVAYAVKKGLFIGTSDTTFAPNRLSTRAMFVTVLWRAEGKPQKDFDILFEDVDPNSYYAEAVRWAESEGIVLGTTTTKFSPNQSITREQIAVIIFRYAKYKGYDVSVGENTSILSYSDAKSVSQYAIPAIHYAVGAGLIKGRSATMLNPRDYATRGEVAAIMHRFLTAHAQ